MALRSAAICLVAVVSTRGDGACNSSEIDMWQSSMAANNNFWSTMNTLYNASASNTTMAASLGVGADCGECFYEYESCMAGNCDPECFGNEEESEGFSDCMPCSVWNCLSPLESCTGVTGYVNLPLWNNSGAACVSSDLWVWQQSAQANNDFFNGTYGWQYLFYQAWTSDEDTNEFIGNLTNTGISTHCGYCFYNYGECIYDNCETDCFNDADETSCLACATENYCVAVLEVCTGVIDGAMDLPLWNKDLPTCNSTERAIWNASMAANNAFFNGTDGWNNLFWNSWTDNEQESDWFNLIVATGVSASCGECFWYYANCLYYQCEADCFDSPDKTTCLACATTNSCISALETCTGASSVDALPLWNEATTTTAPTTMTTTTAHPSSAHGTDGLLVALSALILMAAF